MTIIPSQKFQQMMAENRRHHWERERKKNGWNYAEAASAYGLTVREWAMLECDATPAQLAQGRYPVKEGRPARGT